MRFYVNKQKKLICAPNFSEKWGGVANETVQIYETKFTKVLEKEITDAITSILKKYEAKIKESPFEEVFKERQKALKQMADFDLLATEMIEEATHGE